MLHASPNSALVHRGNALEMLDRLLGGVRRRNLYAGIVERHVEATVLCDRAVNHRGHLRFLGNVASDADRGAAFAHDPLRLLRGEIAVYVGQHDGGAALGEHPRRHEPHAFPGARDHGYLPFEIVDRVHLNLTLRLAQPASGLVKPVGALAAGRSHSMRSTRIVAGPGRSKIETSSITRPSKIIPG